MSPIEACSLKSQVSFFPGGGAGSLLHSFISLYIAKMASTQDLPASAPRPGTISTIAYANSE